MVHTLTLRLRIPSLPFLDAEYEAGIVRLGAHGPIECSMDDAVEGVYVLQDFIRMCRRMEPRDVGVAKHDSLTQVPEAFVSVVTIGEYSHVWRAVGDHIHMGPREAAAVPFADYLCINLAIRRFVGLAAQQRAYG